MQFKLALLLRGVIASRMPGMAAADPAHAFPGPSKRPVFLDRQDEILAATISKSETVRQEGTNDQLIAAYRQDQQAGKECEGQIKQSPHHDGALGASFRATWFTSRINDPHSSSSGGGALLR